MNNKIDSIIFDLDGTLWDTTKVELKSINDIIEKEYTISKITLEQLKNVMGYPLEEAAYILFGEINSEIGIELLNKSARILCQYLRETKAELYDSVKETLEILSKKYKLFIASNCEDGYIETFLDTQHVNNLFVDYEYSGRTGLSKGENIKLIIQRNDLKSPVYVGDTSKDLKAANYVNIPFIYAKYGFGDLDYYPKYVENLKEIFEVIKNYNFEIC